MEVRGARVVLQRVRPSSSMVIVVCDIRCHKFEIMRESHLSTLTCKQVTKHTQTALFDCKSKSFCSAIQYQQTFAWNNVQMKIKYKKLCIGAREDSGHCWNSQHDFLPLSIMRSWHSVAIPSEPIQFVDKLLWFVWTYAYWVFQFHFRVAFHFMVVF